MTSKTDNFKTNEFLRLRKLRLQQVREQSKDIAKKIRQRAKVEQLRHVTNIDVYKEKEYLKQQERLVNRLEELYSKGLQNVGASHRNASEVIEKVIPEKKDLSKLRGKEAVAELKRKKQEKLDEQKKILDRKLQAREVANVLSREKFNIVANNLLKSSSSKSVNDTNDKEVGNKDKVVSDKIQNCEEKPDAITKNDMCTQWEFEEIPNEWEPNIPRISIPNDDSLKNSAADNIEKPYKTKRLNLFALSDEMPSSLRGGVISGQDDREPIKPSLTLVSEYLQNRGLRLREPDTAHTHKKSTDDLQSIKQTLLRTRASRTDVSGGSNNTESKIVSDANRMLRKKNSVTMYDHNTRDSRDLPHTSDKLVFRDQSIDDDAYSQALKEVSSIDIDNDNNGKPHHAVQQETRNRLAMTRQTVDKEYRDTLAFLNSLPKEKPTGCIRTAYMDGDRQQEIKERKQQKLQQAYKKIEKQCSKHQCKHGRNRPILHEQIKTKSKSPPRSDIDNNIVNREFQYSWLPVPESDGSLAVHTIPNTDVNKQNKAGNTVKFSSVDTYHEYRSRHKHTPPTKDVDSEPNKRVVEAVIIQENSDNSMVSSSETDTSSVENLRVKQDNVASNKIGNDHQLADAERIVIYKIMETKKMKKHKTKKKTHKVHTSDDSRNNHTDVTQKACQNISSAGDTAQVTANAVSFSELKEGIYKSVSANGDNIASLYYSDDPQGGGGRSNAKTVTEKEHDHSISGKPVVGENHLNSNLKSCDNCQTADSIKNTDKQPSAATSTSSFKTAVNDKTNNVVLDGGYIKFVDDGGKQDSGKFYVGASGFLKDDAYEVIIQLRKKEAEKSSKTVSNGNNNVDTNTKGINDQNKIAELSGIGSNYEKNISPSKNVIQTGNPENITHEQLNLLSTSKTIAMHEQAPSAPNKVTLEDCSKPDKTTIEPLQTTNKAVSTSFRDTFAIPDDVPKSDTISRPVTSNHTQTSQNSPTVRPVLMHLSSSTSTTYMSPPELILPGYLRNRATDTCDESYEPVSSIINLQNTKIKKCKGSKCGKCKNRERGPKINTPPNSTRSTDPTTDNTGKDRKYIINTDSEVRHVKQHKCKNNLENKVCSKQKFKRTCSENKRLHSGSNYTVLSNKSRKSHNVGKINLNPMIEKYVKELLSLNKEGLKAMEVVNQECSAVGTPGSSIIDVPNNIDRKHSMVCKQISLEQIKNTLKKQILKDIGDRRNPPKCTLKTTGSQTEKMIKLLYKSNRRRPVHKVKSCNISKQLTKSNRENIRQCTKNAEITTSPCSDNIRVDRINRVFSTKGPNNCQNKKICPPRNIANPDSSNVDSYSDSKKKNTKSFFGRDKMKITNSNRFPLKTETSRVSQSYSLPSHRATSTSRSSESEGNDKRNHRNLSTPPISISTQTIQVDSEVEFMKLAENKLQNMEKIADLTEKCTKRLSNLAKVLEEVRRNKSLVYSQFSSSGSTSEMDQNLNKRVEISTDPTINVNPTVDSQPLTDEIMSLPTSPQENLYSANAMTFVPILTGLPKPDTFKPSSPQPITNQNNNSNVNVVKEQLIESNNAGDNMVTEQQGGKYRGKPPPALSRINLKHVPEGFIVPHELSTVVEVDSPMSIKFRSHSTQMDHKQDDTDPDSVGDIDLDKVKDRQIDSDKKPSDQSCQIPKTIPKNKQKSLTTDSLDDSKFKMMDLKQFNEIMMKPFITLQEYAKQYSIREIDGRSNFNGGLREENPNEDLSPLHSETSIPDVVAELLKRNIISEPFKFETTSNGNSTTLSSESTLSLLALNKPRREKKSTTSTLVKNKENVVDSSASLSISSNPDLERAFQRLGLGWASSTLKKTKERLALSSSSNTSSSSFPQFKIKSFNYQDVPELSSLNNSNKEDIVKTQGNSIDIAKNALQQTSLTNSMTVKEFLTNELASKITFSNKTNRNRTEDEFVSLCETKIPDEMKLLTKKSDENEKSVDSVPSGTNNRARTSTPVQIYKSMTYHSTSSSNTSNGLFSNADDLSSVKGTSNSIKNHSTSDKDDLTIPNYSLRTRKEMSECTKSG